MSYYRSVRRDYSEYKYVKYSDSKWKDKKPTYADFGLQESEIDRILQAHREIDEMSEFSLSDDLLALKRKYESRSAIGKALDINNEKETIESREQTERFLYREDRKAKYGDAYGKKQYIEAYKKALTEYEYWQRKKSYDYWMSLVGGNGHAFELEVGNLLRSLGYDADVSPIGADRGVDIIARKGGKRYAVQCKAYGSKVGPAIARDLSGVLSNYPYDGGMLFTLNGISDNAREECANCKKPIEIWDIDRIMSAMGNDDYERQRQNHDKIKDVERDLLGDMVPWRDASKHLNELVKINGPVKNISTFPSGLVLEIGESYPNRNRVKVLIWSEDVGRFQNIWQLMGSEISVRGTPYLYDGIVNIKATEPSQIQDLATVKRDARKKAEDMIEKNALPSYHYFLYDDVCIGNGQMRHITEINKEDGTMTLTEIVIDDETFETSYIDTTYDINDSRLVKWAYAGPISDKLCGGFRLDEILLYVQKKAELYFPHEKSEEGEWYTNPKGNPCIFAALLSLLRRFDFEDELVHITNWYKNNYLAEHNARYEEEQLNKIFPGKYPTEEGWLAGYSEQVFLKVWYELRNLIKDTDNEMARCDISDANIVMVVVALCITLEMNPDYYNDQTRNNPVGWAMDFYEELKANAPEWPSFKPDVFDYKKDNLYTAVVQCYGRLGMELRDFVDDFIHYNR